MSTYKIEKLERKTTSMGKTMIKATIKDNQGATTEGVAIWDSFPLFGSLKEGDVVEGDISTKVNGQYTNHTLNPSATGTPRYGQNKSNGGAITKAMEKKEASIEKFQDNKEISIKTSSTMRDAVLLAIAEKPSSPYSLEDLVVKWRHWLWLQWDKTSPDELAPF